MRLNYFYEFFVLRIFVTVHDVHNSILRMILFCVSLFGSKQMNCQVVDKSVLSQKSMTTVITIPWVNITEEHIISHVYPYFIYEKVPKPLVSLTINIISNTLPLLQQFIHAYYRCTDNV